jgi:hypothetical protein
MDLQHHHAHRWWFDVRVVVVVQKMMVDGDHGLKVHLGDPIHVQLAFRPEKVLVLLHDHPHPRFDKCKANLPAPLHGVHLGRRQVRTAGVLTVQVVQPQR